MECTEESGGGGRLWRQHVWTLPWRNLAGKDKAIEWQLGGWGGSLKIGHNRTCSRLMHSIHRQCSRDGEQLKMIVDLVDFILHDLAPALIRSTTSLFAHPITLVVSLFLCANLSPILGTLHFQFPLLPDLCMSGSSLTWKVSAKMPSSQQRLFWPFHRKEFPQLPPVTPR